MIYLIGFGWLTLSILTGLALGQILQHCEDQQCRHHTAPSPDNQHTAPDASRAE